MGTEGGSNSLEKLTSYEKTKTTQQQAPQRDTHLSPILGPAAAFSSAPPSHRCGRFLWRKGRILKESCGRKSAGMTVNRCPLPSWLGGSAAQGSVCLTLSCRSSAVSFRCEKAAPPPPPAPPPRSSGSAAAIVVWISRSWPKENSRRRRTNGHELVHLLPDMHRTQAEPWKNET